MKIDLHEDIDAGKYEPWLEWAIELQSIAQNALAYTKDIYDKERFERVREISAEMIAMKANMQVETVNGLFCNETGYQTPKLDSRAAVFKNDKILLVKEGDVWSLPGGWIDVNDSVYSNVVKEVKEESGFDVKPLRLIALQDRNKHNHPPYAYGICKVFVLCELLGGTFEDNNETSECRFFSLDETPKLANEKTTIKQIEMCYKANADDNWVVLFD